MKTKMIRKGDIYYAMLNPVMGSEQGGIRPVLVIQNNLANKYSPTVIVAPITSILKKKELPTHIIIDKKDFLKSKSMILLEQIRVLDKSRLKEYIGKLKDSEVKEIERKLSFIFK